MTVGSLFAGFGGFDLGFDRAGFDVRWQVEIEPDAVAVLTKHWPTVRQFRDINAVAYGRARNRQRHNLSLEPVDVIVGGFPCQDVSIAGQRRGLSGSRTGLFFAFMRVLRIMFAQHQKPDWVVLENVPGLLTSHRGRDFHTVLSEVAECGFRRAYRILDSRYFGVAQRRRRVFIVGHRGDAERARAVLFEPESLSGHPAPRREAGQTAPTVPSRRTAGGGLRTDFDCDGGLIPFDTTQITSVSNYSRPKAGDPCHPLAAGAHPPAVAFDARQSDVLQCGDKSGPLDTNGHTIGIRCGMQVRRLTPRECERLQGFPDGWSCTCGVTPYSTAACTCPDTPRYKGLGNAVTATVAEWIARRIATAEESV